MINPFKRKEEAPKKPGEKVRLGETVVRVLQSGDNKDVKSNKQK